jgi:hypothetical protein
VNAAKLNVRVAPNKEAGLLGRLYNQNEVLVTGVVRDSEWVRISFKDWTEAYVSSEFLVNSKDETSYKTIPVNWSGKILNRKDGTVTGPSGKETFYNLNMNKVIEYVRRETGYLEEYWVRDDGVKCLGNYVMVAACFDIRPRGSTIQTSLGIGLVCDTGGFASWNSTQLDVATSW